MQLHENPCFSHNAMLAREDIALHTIVHFCLNRVQMKRIC